MNNQRRRRINKVIKTLTMTDPVTKELLQNAHSELEDIQFDEQMAFDNMPENLQYSMRGMASEEAIDALDDVLDEIQEAIDGNEDDYDELVESVEDKLLDIIL